MKRLLAWMLGGGVVLLVAIAGTGGFLLWRLDPKAEIERQIETATGRDATIAGEVRLSFFPTLGVTAGDVTLANMPGGRAEAMVVAKEVRIGVAPQPLLERKLVVRDLVLRGPVIALEIGADKTPNWVFPSVAKRAPGGDPLGDLRDVIFGDVRVEDGSLTVTDLATDQTYRLDQVNARANLDTLSGPLSIVGSGLRGTDRMSLELRFGEARRLLTGAQTSLVANLVSQPMEAKFEGVLASGGAEIDGKLEANGPSLRRAIALFGDAPAEGGGLGRFAVSGQLAVLPAQARFENGLFTLDGANGRGSLRLDSSGARPNLTGALQIAALDLNPYLTSPAAAGGGGGPSVDAKAEGWSKTPIDLTGLKGFDARVTLTTGPVKFQKSTIDSTRGIVTLTDGQLALKLDEATLYGGSAEGRLSIDAREPGLRLAQDLIFSNISAASFLRDSIGLEFLEGVGQLEITLSGDGATQDALMRSLDGQLSMRLADGAIRGVNLAGVATTISRALRGEMTGANARTKFSSLSATFTLADGVAATRDFRLKANDAEITAIGAIDIGAQQLDLRIVPKAGTFASRMGIGFARVAVPFHVSGSWTKPTYKTDLAAAAQGQLAVKVREVEQRSAARLRALVAGGAP